MRPRGSAEGNDERFSRAGSVVPSVVIPGDAPSKSAVADLDKRYSRTRVNPSSGVEPGTTESER